jgi:hypothetical protein
MINPICSEQCKLDRSGGVGKRERRLVRKVDLKPSPMRRTRLVRKTLYIYSTEDSLRSTKALTRAHGPVPLARIPDLEYARMIAPFPSPTVPFVYDCEYVIKLIWLYHAIQARPSDETYGTGACNVNMLVPAALTNELCTI